MRWYCRDNYNRYKDDLKSYRSDKIDLNDHESIIKKFIDLPETIARGFPIDETACGRLSIEDLIQEGMIGLCIASKMVDAKLVEDSDNQERVINAYLSKRIKGRIRRAIDSARGTIRIPERAIREIRNGESNNELIQNTYFANILGQVEEGIERNRLVVDYNGELKEYNYTFVTAYILGILNAHLTQREANILKMWYGLNTSKKTLSQIADEFGLHSQKVFDIKKGAVEKIDGKINKGLIIDFLFS